MTPALKFLEPVLKAADARGLADFLKGLESEFVRFSRSKKGFLSRLAEYVLSGSGKRVRPGLVYVCSRFGPADPERVRQTAMAVEMIHIATLVHDDLVDEAVLRRQKPTVGVKFGDGAAVLLGDFVYAQAFQRLAGLGAPELLALFSDTTMAMCEGEIGQLEGRYNFEVSEQEYIAFLRQKTASLMAACCRAGGFLAGLDGRAQAALESFGDKVGVAFQIVDDILDLEGEESVIGKTLRTDLTHGKMTLPLIRYAAQLKSSRDREALFDRLKTPNGSVSALVKSVRDSGAMDYCRSCAAGLLAEAEESLKTLPDHPSRAMLLDIASRLSSRKV